MQVTVFASFKQDNKLKGFNSLFNSFCCQIYKMKKMFALQIAKHLSKFQIFSI